MLSHRFYALRIKNLEAFKERRNPEFPNILYATHNNWWDGIVGYNLMRRAFKVRPRMMIEELNRFPLIRRGGAFNVNKKSPQAYLEVSIVERNEAGSKEFQNQQIVRQDFLTTSRNMPKIKPKAKVGSVTV